MINIFKCNNCRFFDSLIGDGTIFVKDNEAFIDYDLSKNFNFHINQDTLDCNDIINDFCNRIDIIPRDPLVYTDWKVGDRVVLKNDNERTGEVIFICGNYVVISDENQDAIGFDVRKFNKYYELVLTDIEKSVESKFDDKPLDKNDLVLYKTYEDDSYSLGYIEELINIKIVKIRDKFDWRNHTVERCLVKPFNEENWKLLK